MESKDQPKQFIYVPTLAKNKIPNTAYANTYPVCRPMHHYRKQGSTTSVFNKTCCQVETKTIGPKYKMLGKKNDGTLKICDEKGPVGSIRGNVMGFTGYATLRRAVQPNLYYLGNNSSGYTPYYTDTNAYLHSRGNRYIDKITIRKDEKSDAYFETTEGLKCKPNITTVFKPNNKQFTVQGAVSCEARLARLKYNTIVKNNNSFVKPYKTNIQYQENPIFIQKYSKTCSQTKCSQNLN
jgi:hypothetical protein